MARSQARIQTTIWHDPDFLALTGTAQRIYFLALSQEQVNFCGVVPYTARRWARLATNTTFKEVTKGIIELVAARFILVDEGTEELFIRSFVKNDGILKSPNLVTAMGRDFLAIHSQRIREAFLKGLPEGFPEGLPEGIVEGLPEVFRRGSRVRSAEPLAFSLLPSSSSGTPSEEEEKDCFTAEAKRRYRTRVGPPVTDPGAWVQATAERLRSEGWQPEAIRPSMPAPKCLVCKDVRLDEACEDCGQ